jgi:hypothetical protein
MTATTTTAPPTSTKKSGRPKKADAPRIAYHELDRLLVFGELVDDGTGRGPATVFPSYRDLAKRYGVSHSVIAAYSSRHDCLRRREAAMQRVDARADDKLVELRATTLADAKARIIETVDRFLSDFEKALREGRVRVDSVSDFNLMVRLKEYLHGGPDSRQEVRATLSLDELQRRYREMLRRTAEGGGIPEVTGVIPQQSPTAALADQLRDAKPPARAFEGQPRKTSGQFAVRDQDDDDPALDGADADDTDTAASD